MHYIGFYCHVPAGVHGQARALEPSAPERAGPPTGRHRACDSFKSRTARRQPHLPQPFGLTPTSDFAAATAQPTRPPGKTPRHSHPPFHGGFVCFQKQAYRSRGRGRRGVAAAAVGAATGKPAASSPPLPQSPRPLNPSKTPRTYSPVRSSPPTTYRAVSCATSRTASFATETRPPPRTGHTHGAALSSSQARVQHHAGSCVTPLATARFSHCTPRSHPIPRGTAARDLGPLLRVQNFEEQKHRLENLRGRLHKFRPQFLTRRGHMQHVSSFPARLKHKPAVSSHLNEEKTLPSHAWTSQKPNIRPCCQNACRDTLQGDASNHVGLTVRRRPPEPYEDSPRTPCCSASPPATCTSSGKI